MKSELDFRLTELRDRVWVYIYGDIVRAFDIPLEYYHSFLFKKKKDTFNIYNIIYWKTSASKIISILLVSFLILQADYFEKGLLY